MSACTPSCIIASAASGVCNAVMRAPTSGASIVSPTRRGSCGSVNVRTSVIPSGPKNSLAWTKRASDGCRRLRGERGSSAQRLLVLGEGPDRLPLVPTVRRQPDWNHPVLDRPELGGRRHPTSLASADGPKAHDPLPRLRTARAGRRQVLRAVRRPAAGRRPEQPAIRDPTAPRGDDFNCRLILSALGDIAAPAADG